MTTKITFGQTHFSYFTDRHDVNEGTRFFSLDYATIGSILHEGYSYKVTLLTSFGEIWFYVHRDDTLAFFNGPLVADPDTPSAGRVAKELMARIEAWQAVPPMPTPGYITPSFSWESE